MKNIIIPIDGMHCDGCKTLIEEVLNEEQGIADVSVSLEQEFVKIQFDEQIITFDQVINIIKEQGYSVNVGGLK